LVFRGVEDWQNACQVTRLQYREDLFQTEFNRSVVKEAQNWEVLFFVFIDFNLGETGTFAPPVKRALKQAS